MPLDRLVLIVLAVIAAAGATVWLVATAAAAAVSPGWSLFLAIPAGLVAYVAWRLWSEREARPGDERYDRIER